MERNKIELAEEWIQKSKELMLEMAHDTLDDYIKIAIKHGFKDHLDIFSLFAFYFYVTQDRDEDMNTEGWEQFLKNERSGIN